MGKLYQIAKYESSKFVNDYDKFTKIIEYYKKELELIIDKVPPQLTNSVIYHVDILELEKRIGLVQNEIDEIIKRNKTYNNFSIEKLECEKKKMEESTKKNIKKIQIIEKLIKLQVTKYSINKELEILRTKTITKDKIEEFLQSKIEEKKEITEILENNIFIMKGDVNSTVNANINIDITKTYKEAKLEDIITQNKDKIGPFFYIIAGEDHWYTIIQEKNIIKVIDLNAKESKLNFGSGFQVTTIGHDQKTQYNGGCCEMQAIMIPFLFLRLKYLNSVVVQDLFASNDTKKGKGKIILSNILYSGLSEEAFGNNVSLSKQELKEILDSKSSEEEKEKEIKEKTFNKRIFILNKQIETLEKEKERGLDLRFDQDNTLCDIFIKHLKEEIEFLTSYKEKFSDLNKSNNSEGKVEYKSINIKGGYMFRESIRILNEVDKSETKLLETFLDKRKEDESKVKPEKLPENGTTQSGVGNVESPEAENTRLHDEMHQLDNLSEDLEHGIIQHQTIGVGINP